jgi:spore coat protein H
VRTLTRLALLAFLPASGSLAACGSDPAAPPDAGPPAPDANPLETSDYVFADDALRTYELTVAPADWQWLQDNADLEQYVHATLRVEGREWPNIGIRYKGGFGTLGLCIDGAGQITCDKLSIKLSFDEYDEAQRFFGLKKLNFHSMIHDPSKLHDRLAYAMFRENGVPAPRAVHAWVTVNGEPIGLYALIEAIDGRFTERHFDPIDGGDGNLYKEIWPNTTAPQPYIDALETNKTAPNVDRMVRFAADLAAAGDAGFRTTIESWMDLDLLARFLAVDRAIENWDGIIAWYCVGGGCFNHNYYWYEDATRDRVTLLPWDMDNTFQVPSPMRTNYGLPDWNEPQTDCTPIPIFFGITGLPPSCEPLMRRMSTQLWPEYAAASQTFLDGPFAEAAVYEKLDRWAAQIEPAVAIDANGPTLTEWQAAVDELRSEIPALRQRILIQLP